MDIKNTEEKIKQVDSLLTTLTNVLKKHWFIILFIFACITAYYTVMEDDSYPENQELSNTTNNNEILDSSLLEEAGTTEEAGTAQEGGTTEEEVDAVTTEETDPTTQ